MDTTDVADRLIEQLVLHEGNKLKPYRDTVGKLTIGIGRNLDDVGIFGDEAIYLCVNDITRARKGCLLAFPFFASLSPIRQRVYVDMAFMGIGTFKGFSKMHEAVQARDYFKAAVEMLDSKWAVQVGARANRLAEMMRTDRDYTA